MKREMGWVAARWILHGTGSREAYAVALFWSWLSRSAAFGLISFLPLHLLQSLGFEPMLWGMHLRCVLFFHKHVQNTALFSAEPKNSLETGIHDRP